MVHKHLQPIDEIIKELFAVTYLKMPSMIIICNSITFENLN
jgi:hypothetical protein